MATTRTRTQDARDENPAMEKFPPKFSKVLVTPDPHYIPGYAGYCPQLKFHMGKPYSQLTAQLLTSPDISRSPRLVLSSGWPPSSTERDTEMRDEIWGVGTERSKTPLRMIPGYTGFIPRKQNYFSRSYSETCREAMCEFDAEQKVRVRPADTLPEVNRTFPGIKPRTLNTPLVPISKEPIPYRSLNSWRPLSSPYCMEDSDPHKYFISGFTGYVPRAKFLMGSGFPFITNRALIQFGKQTKASDSVPGVRGDSTDGEVSTPGIQLAHRGHLPHYTGHVPGYKFLYGQTFGELTRNSLDLVTRRRVNSE